MTPRKKQEAKQTEVKQEVKIATPTPTPVSKQQVTLAKLKTAWQEKGINISKIAEKQDGRYLLVTVADGWPEIKIGPSGGGEIPLLKSYPKFFDACLIANELYAKQTAREARKAAAAVKLEPSEKQEVKPPTPSAKKTKQHEQLEKAMA
jgi:hypothetical protein